MLGQSAIVIGQRNSSANFYARKHASGLRTESAILAEKRKQEKLTFTKALKLLTTNIYAISFTAYGLWIITGVLFYSYYSRWSLATSYFYAMEAGLNIGFCEPSEVDDYSRLFTIFYILVGSSVVSGCLALFATSIISQSLRILDYHNATTVSIEDRLTNKITVQSFFRYIWYQMKYRAGWYSNRPRTVLSILWCIWTGLGTTYGILIEGWTPITALYWAITTCTTGGLQSPNCATGSSTTCDYGTLRGSLMGVYMMVGTPLYVTTLSQYGGSLLSRAIQKRESELLSRPIHHDEFLFAANILSPEGSETLVLGEYILLELMRLGQTNENQIERIKKKFFELDRKKRGEIALSDLRSTGFIIPSKAPLNAINFVNRVRRNSVGSLIALTPNFFNRSQRSSLSSFDIDPDDIKKHNEKENSKGNENSKENEEDFITTTYQPRGVPVDMNIINEIKNNHYDTTTSDRLKVPMYEEIYQPTHGGVDI